jgi:hypothetical protein
MPPEYFYALLGMGFAAFWGVIGTVRWYLRARLEAESSRPSLGGGESELIRVLEERIAELEERVDFHERVIGDQRRELGSGE